MRSVGSALVWVKGILVVVFLACLQTFLSTSVSLSFFTISQTIVTDPVTLAHYFINTNLRKRYITDDYEIYYGYPQYTLNMDVLLLSSN